MKMKTRKLELSPWQIAFLEHATRDALKQKEKELHSPEYLDDIRTLLDLLVRS